MLAKVDPLIEAADKSWFNVVLVIATLAMLVTLGKLRYDFNEERAAIQSQLTPPIKIDNPRAYFDQHGDLIYESDGSEHLKTCQKVQIVRTLVTELGELQVEATVVSGGQNRVGDILSAVRKVKTTLGNRTPAVKLRVEIPKHVARSQIEALRGTQTVDSNEPCEGDAGHKAGGEQPLYTLLLGANDSP